MAEEPPQTISEACLTYLHTLIVAMGPTAGFGEQKDLQAALLDLKEAVKDAPVNKAEPLSPKECFDCGRGPCYMNCGPRSEQNND
jgi:hypothetical protein